jgi:hypothetical protein
MFRKKEYYYQNNNVWVGPVSYKGLKETVPNKDTLVWWEGLCPGKYEKPDLCIHEKIPFKRLQKRRKRRVFALPLMYVFTFLILSIVVLAFIPRENLKDLDAEVEADVLKGKLKFRFRTSYYDIRKISNNEVVEGQKGDYYLVDLSNNHYKDTAFFEEGEFVLNDLDENFSICLIRFIDSVYKIISLSRYDCQLYVKGSADVLGSKTFSKQMNAPYLTDENYKIISFYPKKENSYSLFSSELRTHKIMETYKNEDLPFLRSAFIKQKILAIDNTLLPPIILEGEVNKEEGAEYRNAIMILYVNWGDSKKKEKNWISSFLDKIF